jgi:hypothetical protein
VPTPEKHSYPVAGGRAYWWTQKLWAASANLPVRRVPIAEIAEFERDCWFQGRYAPTCRAAAEHARRIMAADLAYPVVLAADGHLMDGGHRVAKAWLAGETEIAAVRFEITPVPDWIEESAPDRDNPAG